MKRYNFTNLLFLFKIESMIRRFFIIFCLVFLTTCDDGDILSIDLDFEGELERCENDIDSYVIYDTRENPNEALLLIIERDDTNELLFTKPTMVGSPTELTITDGGDTQFIYRSYSRAIESGELCEVIPPDDLVVIENYPAPSGTVKVTATVVDDDNDGIPNEYEGIAGEPDENGIYNQSQDWDEDGIPDYLDQDDDNDNVLTIYEIDNSDGDDDPTTNPLDTDGDGDYDYLDEDDDGDGVDTRLEDLSEDGKDPRNLANKITDTLGIDVYRYLYNYNDGVINANEEFDDTGFIYNIYTRSVTTSFIIENAGFTIISTDYIDFGDFENSFDITNEPEDEDED
ncbi:hypothetical protein HNV10_04975 [Winogradskyella litoriviva]|uniref:Calcium-binding protein n=1 Tax=Winogradskyella litoriviva TaxID=1220182 RepID=A0ABX2E3P1_9FLAO|nr:hypothetical protein [Winogradskyella litoriviva]NRD22581.1 hypothetical protein [Winogradskyella litoriviva]